MTTLLVSGDSWTSCWPLEEQLGHRQFGWPNLVSNHFNFKLIDKSRAGSSNYRIYRKAFDGILSDKVDCCLVFLTSWTRFEFGSTFGNKPGSIYQWLPSEKHDDQNLYAFKNFFNGYKNYTDLLRMIISLQAVSDKVGIPCWFMNTFSNNPLFDFSLDRFLQILKFNPLVFDNMDDNRIEQKFLKTKDLLSQIDYTKFISQLSYQELIDGLPLTKGHPTEQGHKKMSEIVITFLERQLNGKTI
jgi:hypothetical protein